MDKIYIASLSAALTTGITTLAVNKFLKSYGERFKRKAMEREKLYSQIGDKDFIEKGDYISFIGGVCIFVPYLMMCIWFYIETKDVINTMLPVLMFLWIGVMGMCGILSPFLRKVKFNGDNMNYRDVIGSKFSIERDQIISIDIVLASIIVETVEKKYSISSELQNPYRVYAKLKNWNTKESTYPI